MSIRYQSLNPLQYQAIQENVKNGYINVNPHPFYPQLQIFNYSKGCEFDRAWNEITRMCRGLILDVSSPAPKIIAKPFPKFFNFHEAPAEQQKKSLKMKAEITEKWDGSIGISYVFDGQVNIATRGRFDSKQAHVANSIWKEKYESLCPESFHKFTLIFEIIYPENRVIVDYGAMRDLVLIGAYNLETLEEVPYGELLQIGSALHMTVTRLIPLNIKEAMSLFEEEGLNQEGWVCRFEDGSRLKIKLEEYIQSHQLKYGINKRGLMKIWIDGTREKLMPEVAEEYRIGYEAYLDYLEETFQSEKAEILSVAVPVAKAAKGCSNLKEAMDFINAELPKQYRKYAIEEYQGIPFNDEWYRNRMYQYRGKLRSVEQFIQDKLLEQSKVA